MSIGCPECRHILTSGSKCHLPALRGKPFCMHHCRTRNLVEANRARKHSIALPPLEDRQAIQMSIDVVLAALGAGKINRRTAATYVYAIKTVSDRLPRIDQEPPIVPIEICRTENGDILAAEPSATHLQSTPVILSDQSATTNPGAPGLSQLGTGDYTESITNLDDLRNPIASHMHDPEPPKPPTKAELREKRRSVEENLKQYREGLHYWSTLPPEQCEGQDPEIVINYLQKNIDRNEAQLKEIAKLEAPDPEEPDPPL